MSTFALDASSSAEDIVGGINYAIANLNTISSTGTGNVLVANITTGEITTTSSNSGGYANTTIVSYLYQFMDVKYANSSTGGSGFTSSPTLANYYGLRNTSNVTISSNPVDYVWFQVTGGFGITKHLYYQTIGGRQIAFFAGTASPDPSFIVVPDMPAANSTPLNLDTITSAQNNQIVNVNAYYQANTTPGTPSGGTYNFQTFTLTAPAGWSAAIPGFVANTSVYISQAAFVGNTNQTAAPPATTWTTPAVYSSQFQGNTGPAGTRGFLPMGFVITASDPILYSNANLTTAFSSSRSNPSPPIGLGFAPIQYDTAQFAYTNNFTGNTTTIVKQYDGTGWTSVVGNVISGGLFVPGSINANTLNANQIYGLTIASTGADVGNVASSGFWLQASTGNALFAGNVNIGNNLYVANLITAGSLNANTVTTSTIAYNAVTENQIANSSITNQKILTQTIDAAKLVLKTITADQIANTTITGNLIALNTITGNLIVPNTIYGNAIIANTFQANTIDGSVINAGSITATQIAANVLSVGNIVSYNATIGNIASQGYWLQYNTGDVRFGGNVSIGANLNVTGLITQGTLSNSVVTTNSLAVNATNQSVVTQNASDVIIQPFFNGNTTNPTSPGYYWPYNTRAIPASATIVPSQNAINGSRITINYNTFFSVPAPDDSTYNLVELWKTGAQNTYANTITRIKNSPPAYNGTVTSPMTVDFFNLVGTNISANLTANATANVYTTISNVSYASVFNEVGQFGATYYEVLTNQYWAATGYATAVRNSSIAYTGNVSSNAGGRSTPTITVNGQAGQTITLTNGQNPYVGVAVGPNGVILRDTQLATDSISGNLIYGTLDSGYFESSGTTQNLNSVTSNQPEVRFDGLANVSFVAVGNSGTILYNARNYSTANAVVLGTGSVPMTSAWTAITTPTVNNLNGVASNPGYVFFSNISSYQNIAANTFVAVGDSGTICYSNNGVTWTLATTVPTTQNLRSVAYNNGYWVAVGDNGTILTANNVTAPSTWYGPITNAASTVSPQKNLYSVVGGLVNKNFVAGGQGIAIKSNTTNPNGAWSTLSNTNVVSSTYLTRLQFFGSNANILSTSQPPVYSQIANNQLIGATYTDQTYVANTPITYYLVVGNLKGNANLYTGAGSMTVTEYKR